MIDYWTQEARDDKHKNVCGTEVKIYTIITINSGNKICITEPSQVETNDDIVEWLVWVDNEIVAECVSKKAAAEVVSYYVKKFNKNK